MMPVPMTPSRSMLATGTRLARYGAMTEPVKNGQKATNTGPHVMWTILRLSV